MYIYTRLELTFRATAVDVAICDYPWTCDFSPEDIYRQLENGEKTVDCFIYSPHTHIFLFFNTTASHSGTLHDKGGLSGPKSPLN